ncbi:hypothetical protein DCAR_0102362 [Daucus carota subsp. sativus]|uniref:Reverse transcriptase Ty1/copia-type domain-containing protein n=1 Tax=Daucus carota subsp. sativus TaxID=79200 RepID=A0AAF1AHZ6_DAUCS|nr:hypothetical protein DCAR_0102362 [Daucus carota subsp. sativus]
MPTITTLKQLLDAEFSIKDLGPIKYYLGIEFHRSDKGIFMNQQKFITDLLASASMTDCKPLSVPVAPHVKLFDNIDSGELIDNPSQYRAWVGKLLYLTSSRPDISFSVQSLSQFLQAPRTAHMEAARRVLRYLKHTKTHGLFFPSQNTLEFKGYSDSDWAGDVIDRRSVGGYCFLLGSATISWRAKKQSLTSRSSAEAEYRALADASCEVMWLKQLLGELTVPVNGPTTLFCDSKAAVDLTANPVYHARTKHIELDAHFIREKIAHGIVSVIQITSRENVADVLTKGLGKVPHWFCLSQMGLTFTITASALSVDGGSKVLYKNKGKAVITEIEEEENDQSMFDRRGANETIYSHHASTSQPTKQKLLIPFSQTLPYQL